MLKCGNRSNRDKDKRFYRLPSVITHQGEQTLELSRRRQQKWLERIKRVDLKPEQYSNTRVCSDHFVSGSPSALYDENNPDWAPSLNLGCESISTHSIEAKSERYERAVVRSRKRACNIHEGDPAAGVETVESSDCANSVWTQTDLSVQGIDEDISKREDEISNQKSQLEVAREENKEAAKKFKLQVEEFTLNEASFKDNDNKVLYYTGLSTWKLLQKLFAYIKPHLRQQSSLSPFQQLLVTLMRLRLNLGGVDLGYIFNVHASTISRTFEFVIGVLYAKRL